MPTKSKKTRVAKQTCRAKTKGPVWELHLYVCDTTPRSVLASENPQSFCEQYLAGRHRITIIDIVRQPALAREHEILATPTLIRVLPAPEKALIGSLSDTGRLLRALEVGDPPEKYASLLASHVGADAFVRAATRSELPQKEPVYNAPGRMRPGLRVSPTGPRDRSEYRK